MAVTVININDTMIDSGNTTTGYGTDSTAIVGWTSTGSIKRRMLLKFDPAEITAGNVTVELGVYAEGGSGSAQQFDIHLLDDETTHDFSEATSGAGATANWDNYQPALAWGTAGGDFLASPKVSADMRLASGFTLAAYNYFDITDLWTTWQGLSLTYFALTIKHTTESGSTGSWTFNMREGGGDGCILRVTQILSGTSMNEMVGNIGVNIV